MTGFQDLGLNKKLLKSIEEIGWTKPTPIQSGSIPEGLMGKDLFGEAQTGTGKTGAYSLIVLGRTKSGQEKPSTVVLAPTRELADQVSKEMRNLAKYTKHTVTAIYGGASYGKQIEVLENGCDVVVGTPGRILDLESKGILDLSQIKELVLDEADRMLDMGFIEDIEKIISLTPKERQTLMFSATLSEQIYDIAGRSMKEPVEISASHDVPVTDLVKQYYIEIPRSKKVDVLRDIMANGNPKMLIFCSTKIMVDDLYDGFSKEGMKIGAIHGDMPQLRREKTIRGFKNNRMKVLVATDVAARGLDIDDIECVVNYDAPVDPETYTHRIGRAGRAGRTGVSITFVTPKEDRRIPSYQEFMGRSVERLTRKQVSQIKIDNPELKALHANEVVKEQPSVSHRKKVDATARKDVTIKSDMVVISLNIGKNENVNRTELVEFITGITGMSEEQVGRIGISSKASFVEVDGSRAEDVIRAVNSSRLEGKKIKAAFAPQKERCKDKLAKKK
ncbi:MAG: DEAD/DEAH box helicase [Thermoplasmata archaeon]|nr:DEAD/DEAH box helicase [Thermoplasmata archaeon]